MSGAAVPILLGLGIVIGGDALLSAPARAIGPVPGSASLLPAAKPRPNGVRLAACNPCNPCAAKNPCNPCAAASGSASGACAVPRLQSAAAANPCAAKNPNNPCGAANPCNPCGAAEAVEIDAAEARAAYECLAGEMAAYAKAGLQSVAGYTTWANAATGPYQSATHGNRYVNNFVNKTGAEGYLRYEEGAPMPSGTVVAKDSFMVNPDGSLAVGPLFVMEKAKAGFNPASGDWRYTMVMPDGSVAGTTNGDGSAAVEFCNACHVNAAQDQDYLFFLPEDFRVSR
jgi:hypothetical protein